MKTNWPGNPCPYYPTMNKMVGILSELLSCEILAWTIFFFGLKQQNMLIKFFKKCDQQAMTWQFLRMACFWIISESKDAAYLIVPCPFRSLSKTFFFGKREKSADNVSACQIPQSPSPSPSPNPIVQCLSLSLHLHFRYSWWTPPLPTIPPSHTSG